MIINWFLIVLFVDNFIELPFDQEKIIRKIRAVGQTSVAFSPRRQREIIDEEEDEGETNF